MNLMREGADVCFGLAFVGATTKDMPIFVSESRSYLPGIAVHAFNPPSVDVSEFGSLKRKGCMTRLPNHSFPFLFRNDEDRPIRIVNAYPKESVNDGLLLRQQGFITSKDLWMCYSRHRDEQKKRQEFDGSHATSLNFKLEKS